MSQIEITVKLLNELQPTEIVRNDNVRDKFIQIYDAMWSQSTGVSGEAAYEKEARNFNRLLSERGRAQEMQPFFPLHLVS